MKVGDLAWVEVDKRRPAVVIAVSDGRYTVMYGTGTKREVPSVCINHRQRAGLVLQLTKPTYFYATSVVVVSEAALSYRGICLRTYFAIEALIR